MDSNSSSKSDRHRSPIRFSLFTFLLIMTGICILLSYRATHRQARVETSFDLRSHLLRSIGPAPRRYIDFMSRTRFVDPTDDVIVNQVVSDPELADFMVIQSHADPAEWLKQTLQWEIDPDSENLHLSLTVPRGQQSQAQKVFVSVFRAFLLNAAVDDSVKAEIRALNSRK